MQTSNYKNNNGAGFPTPIIFAEQHTPQPLLGNTLQLVLLCYMQYDFT